MDKGTPLDGYFHPWLNIGVNKRNASHLGAKNIKQTNAQNKNQYSGARGGNSASVRFFRTGGSGITFRIPVDHIGESVRHQSR
jgi:hypothetical protein